MRKLLLKLLAATAVFVCVNWEYVGYTEEWLNVDLGRWGAPVFLPWGIGIPLLLILLFLTGTLGEALFPQDVLAHRKVFRAVTQTEFWLTLLVWTAFNFLVYIMFLFWLIIPAAILFGLFLEKKSKIADRFIGYLQEQGIPAGSVKDISVHFSLWNHLRSLPEWQIETEYADTPGIRTYRCIGRDFSPES